MLYSVAARYSWEAAHFLPGVPDTHKCSRMHGHNYVMEIEVDEDELSPNPNGTGFVIDFGELDKIVDPFIKQLDHRVLNDIPGLYNPTAELIAAWFMKRLVGHFLAVRRVTVWETPRYSATVRYERAVAAIRQDAINQKQEERDVA